MEVMIGAWHERHAMDTAHGAADRPASTIGANSLPLGEDYARNCLGA